MKAVSSQDRLCFLMARGMGFHHHPICHSGCSDDISIHLLHVPLLEVGEASEWPSGPAEPLHVACSEKTLVRSRARCSFTPQS